MKHSIKDQIGAVNWARKVVKQVVPTVKKLEQLNDAASTLSALNFIGQDKVLIAPELINATRAMLEFWSENHREQLGVIMTAHFHKIGNILNRLPK